MKFVNKFPAIFCDHRWKTQLKTSSAKVMLFYIHEENVKFSPFNRQGCHLDLNGTSTNLRPLVITAFSFCKPYVHLSLWLAARHQEDWVKWRTTTKGMQKECSFHFMSQRRALAHDGRLKLSVCLPPSLSPSLFLSPSLSQFAQSPFFASRVW